MKGPLPICFPRWECSTQLQLEQVEADCVALKDQPAGLGRKVAQVEVKMKSYLDTRIERSISNTYAGKRSCIAPSKRCCIKDDLLKSLSHNMYMCQELRPVPGDSARFTFHSVRKDPLLPDGPPRLTDCFIVCSSPYLR